MKFNVDTDTNERSVDGSSRRSFIKGIATVSAVGAFGANPVSADGHAPNVRAGSACGSLSLRNESEQPVEVTVSGSNGFSDVVYLDSRNDMRRSIFRLDPADYTVTAQTADGGAATVNDADSQTFAVSECTGGNQPNINVAPSCKEIDYSNASTGIGARVEVSGPNGYTNILDVAAAEEAGLEGLEDGEYTFTPIADNGEGATVNNSDSATITLPTCTEPGTDLQATADCGTVSLRNMIDQTLDVTVDGPNGFVTSVTVSPGSTVDVTGLTKHYEYVVRAQKGDGSVATVNNLGAGVVRVPCAGTGGGGGDGGTTPTADVQASSNSCGTLSVTNTSDRTAVDVSVGGPNGYSNAVSLSTGQSQELTSLAGGEYTLTATESDGSAATVNGSDTATVTVAQCPTPNVGAKTDCDVIRLTNESDSMAVDVTVDGPSGYHQVVNLGTSETRDLSGLESGDYTLIAQTVNGTDATVNDQERETLHVSLCVGGNPVPFS